MVLQKQMLSVSFATGIDTKTDPKLMRGFLVEAFNCEVQNAQLVKTPGYQELGATNNPINQSDPLEAKGLFSQNNILILYDKAHIFSYFPDLNPENVRFSDCGRLDFIRSNPFQSQEFFTDLFSVDTNLNNVKVMKDSFNILSASYGNFSVIYSNSLDTPVAPSYISIFSNQNNKILTVIDTSTNLKIYEIDLRTTPGGFFGTVQEIICYQDFFNVYFQHGTDLYEIKCSYHIVPDFSLATIINVEPLLIFTPPDATLPSLGGFLPIFNRTVLNNQASAIYYNNLVAIIYRIGTNSSSNIRVIIKDLNLNTVLHSFLFLGSPINISTAGDGDFQKFSLKVNTGVINGSLYLLILFGNYLLITDTVSYADRTQILVDFSTLTFPIVYPQPTSGDKTFYMNSIESIDSKVNILCSDFTEFQNYINPPDTQTSHFVYNVPPFIIQSDLTTYPSFSPFIITTPLEKIYENNIVPNDFQQTGNYYGRYYLASDLLVFNKKLFFAINYFPYIGYFVGNTTPFTIPKFIDTHPDQINSLRLSTFLLNDEYEVADIFYKFVGNLMAVPLNNTVAPDGFIALSRSFLSKTRKNNLTEEYTLSYLINNSTSNIGVNRVNIGNLLSFTISATKEESFDSYFFGRSFYLGIGSIYNYSSLNIEEQNYYDFPTIDVSQSPSPGSSTFSYCVIYECENEKGEIIRSAPSIPKTLENVTSGSARVRCTSEPWFSRRFKKSFAKLYMTIDGGNVFYLDGIFSNNSVGTPISFGAAPVSLQEASELLYTSGGVLASFQFEPCYSFIDHKNRICAVQNLNRNVIQFSKSQVIPYALETNPFLTIPVDTRGGDIVAITSLDDKLIIFKEDYIFFVSGDYPDDTGQNSTLTTVQFIQSTVGCIESLSIVRLPIGIMFKSKKGIYLLDRSLQTNYIGDKVEKFNNILISDAVLIESKNQVKFSTFSQYVLTYDYYYNSWTVEDGLNVIASANHNSNYTVVTENGVVLNQTPGFYYRQLLLTPLNSTYNFKCTTEWVKFNQVQGFARVYRMMFLGDFEGRHIIKIGLSYDYYNEVQYTYYFDSDNMAGQATTYGNSAIVWQPVTPLGSPGVYQFELLVPIQKCESIQIRFEDDFVDESGSINGNSFTISNLNFLIGIEKNQYKLPVSKRVS